jgi:hypothetical protein
MIRRVVSDDRRLISIMDKAPLLTFAQFKTIPSRLLILLSVIFRGLTYKNCYSIIIFYRSIKIKKVFIDIMFQNSKFVIYLMGFKVSKRGFRMYLIILKVVF